MATRRWIGNAQSQSQIDTLTIGGTLEVGDVFIVTIGGYQVVYVAASTTIVDERDALLSALTAALSDGMHPSFFGVTFSAGSGDGDILATGTVGVPFVVTPTTTEDGGGAADSQTFTKSNVQAATGPNHWDNADNWAEGSVPADSDDVIIENSSVSIWYGLDQSAVTLTSLTIKRTFTGQIGLPERNSNGYLEYRDTYLAVGATTLSIGDGTRGSGSGRIKIDTGSVQTALSVLYTGSRLSTSGEGEHQFMWKGTHASNAVNVTRGNMGFGALAGESVTIDALDIGSESNRRSDANVFVGSGATVGDIGKYGGQLTIESGFDTLRQFGGDTNIAGGSSARGIDIRGGQINILAGGTFAAVIIFGGVVDCTRKKVARTFTLSTIFSGGALYDRQGTITFSAAMAVKCRLDQCKLDLGEDMLIQRTFS